MPPQEEEEWSFARRLAQPFVREAPRVHETFASWYREARETGISYRRTDMLEDWRRERGLVVHEAELSRLRPETLPPERTWTDTPWPGLRTSLLYEFRMTGAELIIEEGRVVDRRPFERFISLGTDTRLTVGEARSSIVDEYIAMLVYGALEDIELTLVSVRHRTGAEVF